MRDGGVDVAGLRRARVGIVRGIDAHDLLAVEHRQRLPAVAPLGFDAQLINARRQSGETIPAFPIGLDRAFIAGARLPDEDPGIDDHLAGGVGHDAFKIDVIQIIN